MSKQKPQIKIDPRNARQRDDAAKQTIMESLKELGAGRSIVIDSEDVLIAGNGVFEQARKLGIPVRVIETDGKELVAVKRTDLKTDDEKRKALALADNRLTDLSEFDSKQLDELLAEMTPELQRIAGFEESDLKTDDEKPKTVQTRAFKKTHILLSFPPELMIDIQDRLADIITMDGVEYEQSSN